MQPHTLVLPGGGEMPALGFGTFELKGATCVDAVRHALKVGYRHIDTADLYENHESVAEAIADVAREELFLTTKIWHDRLHYDTVLEDAERSLKELRTDYVDLLLIHWPNRRIQMQETFRAFNELLESGKTRAIGVSNFTIAHIREAQEVSKAPIANNQVEFHPYLYQRELLEFCKEQGVTVTAYRPVVRGDVERDEVLQELAKKRGCTPQQAALRWLLDRGLSAIPRSKNPEHIEENWRAQEVELTEEDLQRIDGLNRDKRYVDAEFSEFDRT